MPKTFESFVLLGSPGAKVGTALEESGARLIETSLGNSSHEGENLLQVRLPKAPEYVSIYSGGVELLN